MANKYENIVEEFNKRNCKLLTTKEEHIEILKLAKKSMFKLNYTASCGHNNIWTFKTPVIYAYKYIIYIYIIW